MAELDQFALARKRAQQDSMRQSQQSQDALNRRFAQLGNLNSGARDKMRAQAESDAARNLEAANESITAAELQDKRRQDEIKQAQEFARSERLGSQQFSGEQAALSRAFATGEREASQGFARGEREASQLFSRGERESAQGFASRERKEGQAFARGERQDSQLFSRGEREGAQKFAAGESALARAQQESQFSRGLTEQKAARSSDEKYRNKVFDQTKFDNSENRKLQSRQFDKKLAFDRSQFLDQKSLAERQYDLEKQAQDFNIKQASAKEAGFLGYKNWENSDVFTSTPLGFVAEKAQGLFKKWGM